MIPPYKPFTRKQEQRELKRMMAGLKKAIAVHLRKMEQHNVQHRGSPMKGGTG